MPSILRQTLVLVFVDLAAAYDHIPREFLFRVLEFRTEAKILVTFFQNYMMGLKLIFPVPRPILICWLGANKVDWKARPYLIITLILF